MEKDPVKIHYINDDKISCGRNAENAETTTGIANITCLKCQKLVVKMLEKKTPEKAVEQKMQGKVDIKSIPLREFKAEDLLVIHLSDGTNSVCGVDGDKVNSVFEIDQVTCPVCRVLIDQAYEKADDPIMRVIIRNRDIKEDGVDFHFTYEKVGYHCVNGAIHRLPTSVVKHLQTLKYPVKAYKEGQESGQSMLVTGMYSRFVISMPDLIE